MARDSMKLSRENVEFMKAMEDVEKRSKEVMMMTDDAVDTDKEGINRKKSSRNVLRKKSQSITKQSKEGLGDGDTSKTKQSQEGQGKEAVDDELVVKLKSIVEETSSQKLNKVKIHLNERRKNKKAKRKALKKSLNTGAELRQTMIIKPREIEWWERPVVEYAFSHPHVRSRLEKLMGSNIVRLTDRVYMQKLQERIYEDHLEMQSRRIREREMEEMERQKRLILDGKIPVEEAPEELMEHPVFKVAEMARQIIQSRRKQVKAVSIVSSYYYGTEEGDEAAAREADEVLGITAGRRQSQESKTEECFLTDDEGFMFTPEEYERLKYETPLVKQLRGLETVDEIYALADDIIGPLKTMKRGQHCGTRSKSQKAE